MVCAVSISAGVMAQGGSLEFNQVKVLELNVDNATGQATEKKTILNITVPAGKVWKIESANVAEKYNSSTYDLNYSLGDDGKLFLNETMISPDSDYQPVFPIWLNAGSYTLTLQGNTSSSSYSWNGMVTAIEFNVLTN